MGPRVIDAVIDPPEEQAPVTEEQSARELASSPVGRSGRRRVPAARRRPDRLRRRGHRLPPRRRRAGRRRHDHACREVDRSRSNYCAAIERQLQGNNQVLPLRYLRGGVAGQLALVRGRASSSPTRTASSAGRQYDQKVAELAVGAVATLPEDQQDAVIDDRVVRDVRRRASSRPSASRCWATQGAGSRRPPTPPRPASRRSASWLDDHDVAIDPQFGVEIENGQAVPTDTSVSYAVGDTAKKAQRRQPDQAYAALAAATRSAAAEVADDRARPSGEPLLEFLDGDAPAAGRVRLEGRADPPVAGALPARGDPRDARGDRHREAPGDDAEHLREELGDLLLQVYFHAVIAEEAGEFTIDDVARDITAKMRRRNPHVFAPDGERPAPAATRPRSTTPGRRSRPREKPRDSGHRRAPADAARAAVRRQGARPAARGAGAAAGRTPARGRPGARPGRPAARRWSPRPARPASTPSRRCATPYAACSDASQHGPARAGSRRSRPVGAMATG